MLRVEVGKGVRDTKIDRLWGQHTMEVCYVSCPLDQSPSPTNDGRRSTTAPIAASRKMKQLESNAIILVGQDGLLLVLISDPREAVVDMNASFHRGIKYVVPFKAISDIRILKTEDDDGVKIKAIGSNGVLKPRSVVVHIKGNDAVCRIDTNGATHLAKQMQTAWYAYLVMRSAMLGTLRLTANVNLAEEYLFETIKDLKDPGDRKRSFEALLDEKRTILDEFAAEVWADLQLKELAIRSREIIATCCTLCTDLLKAPPPKMQGMRAAAVQQPQRPRLFTSHRGPEDVNSEVQIRLQAAALQRLSVIRSALKVMCAVLLGSESTTSRHGMLSGPNPLEISSWCALLVPDLYVKLCETLGCPPESEEENVARALKASMSGAGNSLTASFNRNSADRHLSSMSRSDVWLKTTGQHVADSILTPMKEKAEKQAMKIESMLATVCPMGTLAEVQRAVRDLQNVFAHELASIAAIGYSAFNRTILSRNPSAPAAPHAVLYFGDSFSREQGWEGALEEIVIRVSTLLDDMLCSKKMSKDALLEADGLSITWATLRSPRKQTSSMNGSLSPTRGSRGAAGGLGASSGSDSDAHTPPPRRPPIAPKAAPAGPAPGGRGRPPLSLEVPDDDDDPPVSTRKRRNSRALVGELMKSIERGSEFDGYDPFAEELSVSLDVDLTQAGRRQASVPPSPHPSKSGKKGSLGGASAKSSTTRHRQRKSAMEALDEEAGSSDSDTGAKAGAAADAFRAKARCPIETQEILLFYMLSLLHTMALDSARVRQALIDDLQNYWVAIMQVFNLVCPRPRILPKRPVSPTKTSRASNYEEFNGQRAMFAARQPVPESNPDPGPLADIDNAPKRDGFFTRMFKKTTAKRGSQKETYDQPADKDRDAKNLVLPEYVTSNGTDKKVKAAASLLEDNLIPLLVPDYGAPQHGLSAAAWRLLVLSRRLTEEILIALELHRVIPFRVDEPSQAEIAKLHTLRSSGACGHVRRHVSDFYNPVGSPSRSSDRGRGREDSYGEGNYGPARAKHVAALLSASADAIAEGSGRGANRTNRGGKSNDIWADSDDDEDEDKIVAVKLEKLVTLSKTAAGGVAGAAGGGAAGVTPAAPAAGAGAAGAAVPSKRKVSRKAPVYVPVDKTSADDAEADDEGKGEGQHRALAGPKRAESPVKPGSARAR